MADVIDDVEHLLDRAIQYLTHVLNVLLHRVHQNRHRPVNRKTLVRWIAAFMPAPKDPRVYLVRSLGEGPSNSTLQRWASSGSLGSAFSAASLQHLVEEDLGDNLVRFRVGTTHEDGDISANAFDDAHFMPIVDRFTSTPNIEQSEYSSVRSFEEQGGKITEMEAELATLRKQIAMLVMAQESSMMADQGKADTEEEEESDTLSTSTAAACLPLPCSPALCSTLNDSGCESSEGVPTSRPQQQQAPSGLARRCLSVPASSSTPTPAPLVPPAPPPPPPPPLPMLSEVSSGGESVAELIRKRRASANPQRRQSREGRASVPDMVDVLKGLGTVKLRAIDRSPGGTPMSSRRKFDDRTPTDPAAIIARALRKKFASHRGLSPDSDQENDCSSSSFMSDGASSPFGQHMLKKTKRRLSLCNDSDDWVTVSSPLKTLNV